MNTIKNAIRRFLGFTPLLSENKLARAIETVDTSELNENGTVRITLIPATNGKILSISTFKRNPNGPDWTSKYILVPAGEDVAGLIATHLVASAMTQ